MAMGTGVTQESISKAKQSRSEKKARKVMVKLGLKNVPGEFCFVSGKGKIGGMFGTYLGHSGVPGVLVTIYGHP